MIDIQEYLESKMKSIISTWVADDIYAISFDIFSNPTHEYKEHSNLPMFAISYGRKKDYESINNKTKLLEAQWCKAFGGHNSAVISTFGSTEGIEILIEWYKEKGIAHIGYEPPFYYSEEQRERRKYIDKGPIGFYELLLEITAVAKKLRESGFIKDKFKEDIPIIISCTKFEWYILDAIKELNPNGEAEEFLSFLRERGKT